MKMIGPSSPNRPEIILPDALSAAKLKTEAKRHQTLTVTAPGKKLAS